MGFLTLVLDRGCSARNASLLTVKHTTELRNLYLPVKVLEGYHFSAIADLM